MTSAFLKAIAPISRVIPSVKKPKTSKSLKSRLFWVFLVSIIYLLMLNIPIYGVNTDQGIDMFWSLRTILASRRGTLAELGIGPIVTGGMVIQILVGSDIIKVDMSNPKDKQLYNEANKSMSVLMTAFQAIAYILGGAYGQLGPNQASIVFIQLLFAGILVILLDEMVQRGYGWGSGISLFILLGTTEQIIWSSFAPVFGNDGLYYGVVLAIFQVFTSKDRYFREVLVRAGAPDIVSLINTVGLVIFVLYLTMMKIKIPVESSRYRMKFKYPINFMYSSNMPVILATALFANVMLFSQIFRNMFSGNFFVSLLGTYSVTDGRPNPTGGLAYFVTSPRGILDSLIHPYQAIGYILILMVACWFFAKTWADISGMGPEKITEQLLSSNLSIPGIRRRKAPMIEYLAPYINTATVLSGLLIGLIAGLGNVIGAFASGTGLLLGVSISKRLWEEIQREHAEEMAPRMKSFLMGRAAGGA
ncbi:MAG: preprotein translocase subunit SecY [Candidatus Korarchaeota archaeon]|nr:preprotein translocase subunit SecY [Candidatus Korarchaeota archaeon]NIU82846.1 preprotein translocase subunit SecY [Candidatus Thorarchaeota archaeon]NIW13329.1 preprotein translocase subunit SecY [Candidatus Thorarchaeota archaeon]NIW51435.1 preprotein translocase subunit SecY [Candidatus Korarchaeota archaeon]